MLTPALFGFMVLLAAAGIVARTTLKSIIVYEYQTGLKFKKGKLVRTLETGKHWYFKPSTSVQVVDLRARHITVPGQEVLTSDHISLKISLAAEYRVKQPRIACTETENYAQALYLQLQLGLRQIISTRPVDEVLALRGEFGPKLKDLCSQSAQSIGLELVSAQVKDIMFPGALKQMFAQVVRARNEGLAALEKARGETAALRKLANAARIIDQNPTLMQLRLLHSLTESNAATLVVNLSGEHTPGPLRPRGASVKDQGGV